MLSRSRLTLIEQYAIGSAEASIPTVKYYSCNQLSCGIDGLNAALPAVLLVGSPSAPIAV